LKKTKIEQESAETAEEGAEQTGPEETGPEETGPEETGDRRLVSFTRADARTQEENHGRHRRHGKEWIWTASFFRVIRVFRGPSLQREEGTTNDTKNTKEI